MQMTAYMCKPGAVDLDLRTSTVWTRFAEYLMRTKDPVKGPFGKLLPVQYSLQLVDKSLEVLRFWDNSGFASY